MKLRIVIVDDEPLARQRVRDLVEREADAEVVGEAEDGVEAVEAVARLSPDLLFLDIQMAGLDGFAVLEAIPRERRPAVIFTTAYDAYAVHAFDEHAVDYLLKPLDAKRFGEAVTRARHSIAGGTAGSFDRLDQLIERLDRAGSKLRRVVVKEDDRVLFVDVRDVDWFEAAGNYVRLHRGQSTHLVRMTMQRLEEGLDSRVFARIHRSALVNVTRVAELQAAGRGEYDVVLRSGERLRMQRAYHVRLRAALGDF